MKFVFCPIFQGATKQPEYIFLTEKQFPLKSFYARNWLFLTEKQFPLKSFYALNWLSVKPNAALGPKKGCPSWVCGLVGLDYILWFVGLKNPIPYSVVHWSHSAWGSNGMGNLQNWALEPSSWRPKKKMYRTRMLQWRHKIFGQILMYVNIK